MTRPYHSSPLRSVFLLVLLATAGCRGSSAPTTNVQQQRVMPAKTVLLSTMMSDLSAQPGFTDQVMAVLEKQSKTGAAILSPKLVKAMRELILGKDWQGLDRFPGWTMGDINPVVDVAGNVVKPTAEQVAQPITAYVDLGPYGLDKKQTIGLDQPSTLPGFSSEGLVEALGDSVVRGDGANPKIAPMHSESARLADVMDRLAMNRLEGTAPVSATLGGKAASTPEDLVRALLASGHEVRVVDARYFANFGHLHYEGNDVMMPFWVNAGVYVPGTDRQLKVPVAHAEYEWFVRGPKINADISFYFGIDGKAEFRVMDTLDQAWVMGHYAHEYRGADAVEVTRLTGLLALAYAHAHIAYPRLAFGGYYPLGVCQDGVAAIEYKMTGKATLFPNTADITFFRDARDAEINALLTAIPKDRDGAPPPMERVFGSLPTDDISAIGIPGLADDLERVQQGWHDGSLRYRKHLPWLTIALWTAAGAILVLLGLLIWRRRFRSAVR